MQPPPNDARTLILLSLALAVAIAACYAQVAGHDFVEYDDPEYVVNNARLLNGLTLENTQWALTTGSVSNWHPLTWLSYMLDIELAGGQANPGRMLLMNVLLHIINSVLVLTVFTKLTGSIWRSVLVAAVFALHPLHVESVAWVSERKDVLSALFGLLAVLAYAEYAKGRGAAWYAATLVSFTLALLAKPMLVTLPFVLLLLDFWPLRQARAQATWMRLIIEKIPLLAMSAAVCVITILVQRQSGAISVGESIPLEARLQHLPVAYVTYLLQTVWPLNLSAFYPHPGAPSIPVLMISTTVLFAITLVAVLMRRTHPHVIVGWLWFLGMLVPVIGLVQVGEQAHADRYMYLPQVGLTIMLAWSFPKLAKPLGGVLVAACIVALMLLGALTFKQVKVWRNTQTLFEHALASTDGNHVAHYGLGRWHFTHERSNEAAAHLRAAVNAKPKHPQALTNLGLALEALGQVEAAAQAHRQAIEIAPSYAEAHHNLGTLLARAGRLNDSIGPLQRARELTPDSFETNYNLGRILQALRRFDESRECLLDALRAKPDLADAHQALGEIAETTGNQAEAMAHYESVLRLRPGDSLAAASLQRLRQERSNRLPQ